MASNKYNFSTSKTMRVAQQLYEGIAVTSSETMGLITYMRTDSTRVAKEAQEMAAEYILNNFGKEYLSENPNRFKQKNKNVQDAHEAIRPTQVIRTPESLRKVLTPDQYKLYKIIWEIFVASQMSAAVFDTRTILVNSGKYEFSVKGSVKLFDGFTKVSFRDNKDIILPDFKETEQFEFNSLEKTQNFTKPPARFTEATLVKELEEKGIGRPSTYATIVSTIINRKYIDKIERNLKPTYLGREVNDFLNLKFDNIIEVGFTADMEANLDKIENEGENWQNILKDFYVKFENDISLIMKNIKEIKKNMVKYTKFDCEKCGSKLVLKITPKGKFAACPNYPKCKNIKNVEINEDNEIKILEDEVLEENCPDCGKPLMLKRGKFGEFIACSNYPKCKFRKQKELDISCPKDGCDGKIVLRTIRKGRKFGKKFYGCSKYPDCDFVSWNEPVNKECPLCKSSYLVVSKKKKDVIELKCPDKNCSYTEQQTIDE
jgi:DNA topoisomerase-1